MINNGGDGATALYYPTAVSLPLNMSMGDADTTAVISTSPSPLVQPPSVGSTGDDRRSAPYEASTTDALCAELAHVSLRPSSTGDTRLSVVPSSDGRQVRREYGGEGGKWLS